jgi:hypothetical protein
LCRCPEGTKVREKVGKGSDVDILRKQRKTRSQVAYEDVLFDLINQIKAISTIPVTNPRAKSMDSKAVKSGFIGIKAIASIPVKKPAIKIANPKTRSPPVKPCSPGIIPYQGLLYFGFSIKEFSPEPSRAAKLLRFNNALVNLALVAVRMAASGVVV